MTDKTTLPEPVAYRVHDMMVPRMPVKARGRFEAPEEYLYPASRADDATEMSRMMRAECTPLYTATQLQEALSAAEGVKPREIRAMAHLIGVLADDMTESNWADKRLYIKQQAKRIRARAEALGLTALTAAEGVKPRVKPLEWLKHPKANLWRAECIIGIYQVYAVIPHAEWQFDAFDGIKTTGESENPSEAKAAAQADYEARITSALQEGE